MSSSGLSIPELQAILEQAPYHRLFDLAFVPRDAADEVELHMPFTAAAERVPGSGQLHGGVLASLGDIAGSFVIGRTLGVAGATLHFSIEYMRPALGTGVSAVARIRRLGKSIGFVDIDIVTDSGTVVALGRGVYSFTRLG